MYAKKSSSVILFRMLNQMLQYSFTTEDKRSFIYARLNLLDQYYCLNIELQLWQSYLEIALQLHTWPVSIFF